MQNSYSRSNFPSKLHYLKMALIYEKTKKNVKYSKIFLDFLTTVPIIPTTTIYF